jgi:hypothetical protein
MSGNSSTDREPENEYGFTDKEVDYIKETFADDEQKGGRRRKHRSRKSRKSRKSRRSRKSRKSRRSRKHRRH